MLKKFNGLLLVLTLFITFSCSNQPTKIDENLSRTISSENEDCRAMLERFLPKADRLENKVSSSVGHEAANGIQAFAMTKEMKAIDSAAELESSQLFSSFNKEAKDLATAGKFKALVDPHEALMARIMLIRKAKKSIDLTYYIFQDSETSKILIGEIRAAIRRGVNVRLMVDGSGSVAATANFFKEIQVLTHTIGGDILDEAGNVTGKAKFEAIEINPTFNVRANIKEWYYKVVSMVTGKAPPADDFSIFHRSHDKILMIDAASPEDSMAIVGGRNISNHYYKIGTEEERDSTFNDLDILVKNIAFTQTKGDKEVVRNILLEHFNRLYYYSANKRFEDFIFKVSRGTAAKTLNQIRNTRNELVRSEGAELAEKLAKMESDDYLNSGFDHGYISFLDEIENLVRKNPLKNLSYETNKNSIIKNLWSQIEKAEKDILICSPYVYLTDKEMDFLASWLKENPARTFRLITNSSATSDNLFAQSMVENFVMPKLLKKFKDAGISEKQFEILAYGNMANKEFGGTVAQGKLHAKFWMIDNYAIGVGTSNFDPISRLTNSEVVANVFSLEGNQTVTSISKYYKSLRDSSTQWGNDEFMKAKFRPELKKKLMIQSFIAKIIKAFNLLPQE